PDGTPPPKHAPLVADRELLAPSLSGVAANWLGGHAGPAPRTAADTSGSSADPPHCAFADTPGDRRPLHTPRSASTVCPPFRVRMPSTFATRTTFETPPFDCGIPRQSWRNTPPARCDAIHGSFDYGRVSSGIRAENRGSPRYSKNRPGTRSAWIPED